MLSASLGGVLTSYIIRIYRSKMNCSSRTQRQNLRTIINDRIKWKDLLDHDGEILIEYLELVLTYRSETVCLIGKLIRPLGRN